MSYSLHSAPLCHPIPVCPYGRVCIWLVVPISQKAPEVMAVLWLLLALAAIPGGFPRQSAAVCELAMGGRDPHDSPSPWNNLGDTQRLAETHICKCNEDLPTSGSWDTEETIEQWSSVLSPDQEHRHYLGKCSRCTLSAPALI